MKVLNLFAAFVLAAVVFASCGGNAKPQIEGVSKAQVDSVSYAVGVSFGQMIKGSGLEGLNYGKIMEAMKDIEKGNEPKISQEKAGMIINSYMTKVQIATQRAKEKAEQEFFAANAKNEGVQQTESGLQYKIDELGNDVRATEKDTVEVHYKGTRIDGTVFDSSYDRGETASFPLNRVIPGWTEGMQLVGEGGKLTLWVPYNLGYGPRQMSEELPPYTTLIFEVELIKVKKAVEKPVEKKK